MAEGSQRGETWWIKVRDELRSQLIILRRAECRRKKRRKIARAKMEFMKGPFKYLKTMPGNHRNGNHKSKVSQVELSQVEPGRAC